MEQKNNLIYHYTGYQNVFNICKDGKLTFFASRYDCMNDPLEMTFAKENILPHIKEVLNNDDNLQEAQKEADEIWPYVISFCKHRDDFTMWRLYSATACLILDRDVIESESMKQREGEIIGNRGDRECDRPILLEDCLYVNKGDAFKRYRKLYNDVCEKLYGNENCDIYKMETHRLCLAFVKQDGFSNENEVRYVNCSQEMMTMRYNEQNGIVEKEQYENTAGLHFRNRNNDIVLYKEIAFPQKALKEIILNCHNKGTFDKQKGHLGLWLRHNGFNINDVAITRTVTPPIQ